MFFKAAGKKGTGMDDQIRKLSEYIARSNYTVAITGAGISLSAGGVTFGELIRINTRPGASRDPEKMYETFSRGFFNSMFRHAPSLCHKALSEMEEKGDLQGIITTNGDCIHTLAGSQNVAEIQGSFQINICPGCGRHYDDCHIWEQGKAPTCASCGDTILPVHLHNGIGLIDEEVEKARNWIAQAELILVIGTNGYFRNAYWDDRRRDAVVVQINPGRTNFDRVASLNIKEDADTVFSKLMEVK